ncbi:MAG: dihydrolipoyl dehydrogenase [Simkania sp.]|nr:dihydrolipoyl dehydrogenase [Simkania sp.]
MSDTFDIIILGSGPGGYVAALRAAQLGLTVACVEKNEQLGGTCLNVGCIPSKTLLYSSEMFYRMSHEGKTLGIIGSDLTYDWVAMQKRRADVVSGFNQGIAALFKKGRIQRFLGVGDLISPTEVRIDGKQILQSKAIILATGSEPISLPFLPFDEKKVLSSTAALILASPPKKMVVIGAGVIGVELGSVYQRLGTEVQFIEFLDRICPTFDEAITKQLQQILSAQGLTFQLSSKVTSAEITDQGVSLHFESVKGGKGEIAADCVLVAIGRRPYTQGLGLANVGIQVSSKGFIPVDGGFRTSVPSVYAIGDLIDGPMLAHKASEEGVAVAEIIAGKCPVIDYMALPSVIYTSPEVAAVGFTEAEAKQHGLEVAVGTFSFKANSRARCSNEDQGFVKVIADKQSDRLLGVHILGFHASELISGCAIALEQRMTSGELANCPFAHPTLAEAVKEAALAVHKRALHQ